MNQKEYITLSLELHLFFDRIMKEHSLFLEASFLEKEKEQKKIANNFKKAFSNLLEMVIPLSKNRISQDIVESFELVTRNTLEAEQKTSNLLGIPINTKITMEEMNLRNNNQGMNQDITKEVREINQKTLPLLKELIHFKSEILNQVLSCKIYTTNYPLLISHIRKEAQLYYNLLSKVESGQLFTKNDLYEQEIFWNDIMKEHAEFMRGLFDPSEESLILTSDKFNEEYKMILQKYSKNPRLLTKASLTETLNFRDFKMVGEEGLLRCRIKSIMNPLFIDHNVREANHFIRILNSIHIIT